MTCAQKALQLTAYLIFTGVLFGEQYTGVVYSDHSGPSGNSVGPIELATKAGAISKPLSNGRAQLQRCAPRRFPSAQFGRQL